ncbi:MAG: DUF790 family protein [Nitrososphaerota archaeon]
MLPRDFLRVRVRGGFVRPAYAHPDGPASALAEEILKIYRISVGRKRAEIRSRVLDLEEAYGDYKLVRGLAELVERKCLFEGRPAVNPASARLMLFSEAARCGIPVTPEERVRVIERVASMLGVSPSSLEDSLYADLECEERLIQPPPEFPGEQLVKEYNLSLTQTLLFDSVNIVFTASGNWKRIFRSIKFYGLIYEAWRASTGFAVKVDGPLSIFRMTRRYGTSLAKVLPEIIRGAPWHLSAEVMRGEGETLRFTLDSESDGHLLPESPETPEEYDSEVERRFAEAFRAVAPEWAVRREAEPIPAGPGVIIPDFILEKAGRKVAVEIVGFWTPEYLRRKVEKLASARDMPIIVAVDEKLACSDVERVWSQNPSLHIIYYKGRVKIPDVLKALKEVVGEEQAERRTEEAKGRPASKSAIKAVFEEAAKALMEEVGERGPLLRAADVLKRFNLTIDALPQCGYKIVWKTLMLEDAEVRKEIDS